MALNWQERIVSDPQIMFGKPVIRGTRIPLELVLEKSSMVRPLKICWSPILGSREKMFPPACFMHSTV